MVAHDIVRPMPVPAPSPDARAVVTGASQNIGEALATELAARGHHLIVTARREDVLRTLADRITEKYGVVVEVRPVDLADPAERAKLADELAGRNISILCANAGTATFGPVGDAGPGRREGTGAAECPWRARPRHSRCCPEWSNARPAES